MKSFEEYFIMEEKLTTKDRDKLSDDDYGIIIKDKDGNVTERAYPLNDAKHVEAAARMYPFAKRKYDASVVAELRRKIIAKAKEYNVPDSKIQSVIDDNPGGKAKAVKESVGPLDDDTTGTSEFDESFDNEPDDCYTESEKPEKMKKVSPPDSKYVYFASPENYMPEMKLNRPLFVTPYKSIASIFISRDMGLQNRIPKGSYNMQYEEWLKFNEKESGRCLKDVHVYVEGYPDLEPYEIKQTGYVHQILTHNWNDNYYRYPWMDASKEWLIANDNGNVEFDDVTECEIKYHVSGKPGWKGLGPAPGATYEFVKHAIKLIHDKYKKDQRQPVGNQNCLLCTWCFEARMRGLDVLPRPVYSPRDDVLDIPGNQIVFDSRQIKLKNYTDLASEITKAGDGCRFYCHVNWKDSKGGHEFILMRIGGKNFIIDPQQGKIEPLTKSHNYVSDINYDNSYIVQLSGKKFNRKLFDKWNNSGPLLWDPEKDIPYMLKEGMITKEEAEKEFNKPIQESFNIDGQNIDDLNNGKIDEFISIYENKTFINLINKFNSKHHYSDAFKRVAEKFYSDADDDKYEATRNGYVEYFLKPEQLYFVTKRDKPIGIVFAGAGYYDYEVFIISLNDGSVYYTKIADEYRVSNTFVEFIKSFNDGYFDKCLNKHVQESWNTEESLKLFKKLPKDLQEFLENGDFSMLRHEDESFYDVAGYCVEDFYKPSELELCGETYSLEEDDPYYNAIIFSYENSNSFGFNPKDDSYYYFYHDEYEVKNGKEYIEPYKLKQKTWNEIIKVIPKERVYYRFEYEGEGIYDAYKHHATWLQWHKFKQSYAASWLNVVPNYRIGEKSYFTEEGYKMFMKHTYPEMIKVLDESKIEEIRVNLKPEDIRYEDKYQATTKAGVPEPKPVQEGVIQNIKNKTSPFEKNLVYHISPKGHLDGQVFKPRVPEYLDKYDPTKTEFEDVETPRVCFSPSIEGCLNAIIVNIGRWKTAEKLRDWYVYIPEKPLKEYKYRTTKQLVDEKKVYDANLTKEVWIEEPVRLKQYGVIRIDSVTDKSRKKAVPTTLGESKKRNVYDFKWHWLVKPKVLKDVPYDYSPLEVCKDMVADLERYKYGIPMNGRIVGGSEHDYDTKWKLQSPEEFEKNGGGICYDYVEFEEGYLDTYGIKCKKYFISTDLPGHDTHTFILVDDGKGGFVYPEASFKPMAGAHEVKSLDQACSMVADGFWKINDNLKKVKPTKQPNMNKAAKSFKCYLWEYTGHPPYGSNMATCTKYYSKGEPIKEWTQVEPNFGEPKSDKAKALQEFVTHFRGGI